METKLELMLKIGTTLGETPVWDEDNSCWYFVDIVNNNIHKYEVDNNISKLTTVDVGQSVGCIALREKGGLIAGLSDGIYNINFEEGTKELFCDPEPHLPGNRFNDGKCDPAGRFVVGSLSAKLDKGCDEDGPVGNLHLIKEDGTSEVLLSNLAVPNGLAWNSSADTFYFIDSAKKTVCAYDYDNATGKISNERVVLDFTKEDGMPDGMCIDKEDNLWIGFFNGRRICYCDPVAGKVLKTIETDAQDATCTAFGGKNYDTLIVTTAQLSSDLSVFPNAGSLFEMKTDVLGLAPVKFKG